MGDLRPRVDYMSTQEECLRCRKLAHWRRFFFRSERLHIKLVYVFSEAPDEDETVCFVYTADFNGVLL